MKSELSLLSIPEFAAALRVTPACVRRWKILNKVAYTKVGRLVRIPSTEVNRLVTENFVPARRAKS